MIFFLHEDLKPFFSPLAPLFDQLMALKGTCFRSQKGRLTQRVTIGNKSYFIKQHFGVGYHEIFKNLLQGRWPVISARNEWQALLNLQKAGISVPEVLGYGQRYLNPAHTESFILMEDVAPANSLEEICATWKDAPPLPRFKRWLIVEVARIAYLMHQQGINHRDFYICHFLLKENTCYLIDLHRAEQWQKVPERWLIKDLAALYFSSKDAGLTRRDVYRFMCYYRQKSLREIMRKEAKFWEKIRQRGEQLYRDHLNK